MPGTLVQGVLAPQDYDQDQIERVVHKSVLEAWEDEARLFRIYMMLPKKSEGNYAFHHFESDPLIDQSDTAAANALAGDTTITVSNGLKWVKGDVGHIKNAVGTEQFYVSQTPVGNVLTVIRNIDAVGAIAITLGDLIINDGPAIGDGAGRPEARQTVPTEVENFTQNFRNTIVKLTGRQRYTQMRTSPEAARLRKEGIIRHKAQVERTSLFGTYAKFNDPDGYQVTTTKGLISYISTNKKSIASFGDANTAMTEKEWNEFLELAFWKGSKKKVAITSGWMATQLANFNLTKLVYSTPENTFGFGDADMEFPVIAKTPRGTLGIIEHAQLYSYGNATRSANYGAHCIVLDMDQLEFVEHTGRGFELTIYNGKKENNGYDQYVEEVSQDIGLDLWHEDHHAILYGVTAIA